MAQPPAGAAKGVASVPGVGAGPGRRDADSFYVEDCQAAQANTHAIQTLTGQISRRVGTLEGDEDYGACRQLVDQAMRQARDTQVILKRIQEHQRQAQNASERSNRRMMYHKLSDNLAITARVLEDVVRRFAAEEQKRFAASLASPAGADAAGGDDYLLEAIADPCEEPARRAEVAETARRRADDDMGCLQQIYSDLAVSAEDQQGASYEALENHMAMAGEMDIERGTEDISNSRYNRERTYRRQVMMLAGALVAVASVTAFLASG